MKIKNSQIIIAIIGFLGVYILLAGYLKLTEPIEVSLKTGEDNKVVLETTSETVVKPLSEGLPEETMKINFSLNVLGKSYQIETQENTSLFDAMKDLQNKKENNFSFNYKEYPGMGIFIDEINDVKGKSGAYWIYYINGKEASVGVSSYILKEGDSILWKQE